MDTMISAYVQGLVTGHNLESSVRIELVDDRCHGLSKEARKLLRLSYQCNSPTNACRWGSCVAPSTSKRKQADKKVEKTKNSPARPNRRASLENPSLKWRSDNLPHLKLRSAEARSCVKWAMALDAELQDDDDDELDDSAYSSGSNFDFDDYETESESDDSDSDSDSGSSDSSYDSDDDYSVSESSEEDDDEYANKLFQNQRMNPHEWTLPKNSILPNMQEIFREAAMNPNMDIMARIQQATCKSNAAA